jgi:hypothetical protein
VHSKTKKKGIGGESKNKTQIALLNMNVTVKEEQKDEGSMNKHK